MPVAQGKKRYMITLTVDTVARFQELTEKLGMAPGTMSKTLDDYLATVTRTIEELAKRGQEKGKVTLADMLALMAKEMEGQDDADEIPKKVQKRAAGKN